MARDWAYKHENMPKETDKEFVAFVEMALREGVMSNVWQPRLIEIAKRAVAKDKK